MQALFEEVGSLDRRCYDTFKLSEDILMEHAAEGMAAYIREAFEPAGTVCIICGPGNNGGDGIALGRLLHGDYEVSLYLPSGAHSQACELQLRRAEAVGVRFVNTISTCDILVDALFGTGFSRSFDKLNASLLEQMNQANAFKIACDIPSGLHRDGRMETRTFCANVTLTMGALKRAMFSDQAKRVVGDIAVIDLGISRTLYEQPSRWQLLDDKDLRLPLRNDVASHKGSYGHLGVICGEKEGAAIITGSAALHFGAGLVTLISNVQAQIPAELMRSHLLPTAATAIAIGMGLGQEFSENELRSLLEHDLPLIIDADLFTHPMLPLLLKRNHIVLTPHPKEFAALLKCTGLADIGTEELQDNRFTYVETFAAAYPNAVLLLKGANVIIAGEGRFFINPHGSNVLAKGGSGDVLSGLIGALLAQRYTPLDAAIHASLAHTRSASRFTHNNYALTPHDLIKGLKHL